MCMHVCVCVGVRVNTQVLIMHCDCICANTLSNNHSTHYTLHCTYTIIHYIHTNYPGGVVKPVVKLTKVNSHELYTFGHYTTHVSV
jgi:hypothetical protein